MRYPLEPTYRRYMYRHKGFCHLQENLEINVVKN